MGDAEKDPDCEAASVLRPESAEDKLDTGEAEKIEAGAENKPESVEDALVVIVSGGTSE